MGEIAEMMLDGTMCQNCGEWLNDGEDGDGFPQSCSGCSGGHIGSGKKARHKRKLARKRAERHSRIDQADKSVWKINCKWHWQREVNGMQLDYWPSTNKARYNGKTYTAVTNAKEFIEWLENAKPGAL